MRSRKRSLSGFREVIVDLGLNGRTALVFGAGGGLGGAIARTLAAEGMNVAAAVHREESVSEFEGDNFLPLVWDLADPAVIESKIAAIEKRFGAVDVLVNNTGGPPPTPALGQSPELWEKSFNSMVLSVIRITDRLVPAMRERKFGRVITSASSGVVAPIPNLGISNALRSSLVGWSKTLAREVAGDGVTVNVVLPGRIATKRITFLDEQRAKREGRPVEEIAVESAASIPAGRYGTPEEYADVVAFLASQRASYVTGSILRVDGGMIPSI